MRACIIACHSSVKRRGSNVADFSERRARPNAKANAASEDNPSITSWSTFSGRSRELSVVDACSRTSMDTAVENVPYCRLNGRYGVEARAAAPLRSALLARRNSLVIKALFGRDNFNQHQGQSVLTGESCPEAMAATHLVLRLRQEPFAVPSCAYASGRGVRRSTVSGYRLISHDQSQG